MLDISKILSLSKYLFKQNCFGIFCVAVVSPNHNPKFVRNRCVIEHFGGGFVLSLYSVEFSVGIWALVIRQSQIPFFFSIKNQYEWSSILF